MTDESPIVAVIDDDLSVRESIQGLLETAALRVELFASPREYLQAKWKDHPSCIILDVRLPGSSGLDFQREMGAAARCKFVFAFCADVQGRASVLPVAGEEAGGEGKEDGGDDVEAGAGEDGIAQGLFREAGFERNRGFELRDTGISGHASPRYPTRQTKHLRYSFSTQAVLMG